MKKILSTTTCALALIVSAPVQADSWDDYTNIYAQRFYRLDQQDVEGFTCRIESSVLDALINKKLQTAPKEAIAINHNTQDFSVTYKKPNIITFHAPTINAEIRDASKVKNSKTTKAELDFITNNYAMITLGIQNTTRTSIESLFTPKKESLNNLAVIKEDETIYVTYDHNNVKTTIVQKGLKEETQIQTPQNKMMQGKISFMKNKDKILPESVESTLSNEDKKITNKTKIGYQDFGKFIFPSKIKNETIIEIPNASPFQTVFDIRITNCRLTP